MNGGVILFGGRDLAANIICHSSKTMGDNKKHFTVAACDKLKDVEGFIEQNLNTSISLEALASVACMSPSHFGRRFKKSHGLAPSQYIIRRRIARAVFLLEKTELSVTDIGLEVGYQELSNFSKAFRKVMGTTPTQYRNKNRPIQKSSSSRR